MAGGCGFDTGVFTAESAFKEPPPCTTIPTTSTSRLSVNSMLIPGTYCSRGDGGHWYDYDIDLSEFTRIEPSDAWAVDITDRVALRIEVPKDILAS